MPGGWIAGLGQGLQNAAGTMQQYGQDRQRYQQVAIEQALRQQQMDEEKRRNAALEAAQAQQEQRMRDQQQQQLMQDFLKNLPSQGATTGSAPGMADQVRKSGYGAFIQGGPGGIEATPASVGRLPMNADLMTNIPVTGERFTPMIPSSERVSQDRMQQQFLLQEDKQNQLQHENRMDRERLERQRARDSQDSRYQTGMVTAAITRANATGANQGNDNDRLWAALDAQTQQGRTTNRINSLYRQLSALGDPLMDVPGSPEAANRTRITLELQKLEDALESAPAPSAGRSGPKKDSLGIR